MILTENAFAKINLFLEITGRRDDGYHLLQSLAAFTQFADMISIEEADKTTLEITGPFANAISAENNLIIKALDEHNKIAGISAQYEIKLEKNIPVAAGLGGGSADAAAMLRLLGRTTPLADEQIAQICTWLGADVLMCYYSKPAFVSGIGDVIEPFDELPAYHVLLVNPNIGVDTANIYKEFSLSGMAFTDTNKSKEYLGRKNDLLIPALKMVPEIAKILDALMKLEGCVAHSMSGSGATCFALFASHKEADAAARQVSNLFPEYWTKVTQIKKAA